MASYVISEGEDRPGWDDFWLMMASTYSLRADCSRRQVGAVIVTSDNLRLVSAGYNGSPAGGPSCLAGQCPRGRMSKEEVAPGTSYDNCIAVHAEVNAVIRASWEEMLGATLYCTDPPCLDCGKVISATPISRVVTPRGEWVFDHQVYRVRD